MLAKHGRKETAWQLEAEATTELYHHAVITQTEEIRQTGWDQFNSLAGLSGPLWIW